YEGASFADDEIPDSLRTLIALTLDTLPEDLRPLLSIGAVQGYEFDSLVVADVMGLSPSAVEERLDEADRIHGLLTSKGEDTLPNGRTSVRYRCVHVLYQEALYAAIVPSQRVEWARRVAEALRHAHATNAELIAGHVAVLFEAGREYWNAAEQFLTASRVAA